MGYKTVNMMDGEDRKRILKVHRMVAEAVIPMVDGKDTVNHKNGNKIDNVVGSIEWCLRPYNP